MQTINLTEKLIKFFEISNYNKDGEEKQLLKIIIDMNFQCIENENKVYKEIPVFCTIFDEKIIQLCQENYKQDCYNFITLLNVNLYQADVRSKIVTDKTTGENILNKNGEPRLVHGLKSFNAILNSNNGLIFTYKEKAVAANTKNDNVDDEIPF
jgi:hypothetical protein